MRSQFHYTLPSWRIMNGFAHAHMPRPPSGHTITVNFTQMLKKWLQTQFSRTGCNFLTCCNPPKSGLAMCSSQYELLTEPGFIKNGQDQSTHIRFKAPDGDHHHPPTPHPPEFIKYFLSGTSSPLVPDNNTLYISRAATDAHYPGLWEN